MADDRPAVDPPAIRDDRVRPQSTVPRLLHGWLMAGLALVMVAIILITGQTTPRPTRGSSLPSLTDTARPPSPDRVQAYQQALDQRARALEQEIQRLQADTAAVETAPPAPRATGGGRPTPEPDPLSEARRRKDEQSLFADVVVTHRPDGRAAAAPPPTPASAATPVASPPDAPGPSAPESTARPSRSTETLLEGTLIPAVLTTRLDGTFAGPVQCVVTSPVYSAQRHAILIPAGARVLGTARAVTAFGDRRLAVAFHRLIFPDGRAVSLEDATGLNGIGETGLADQVDRHYRQIFGATLAVGALSGLTQLGTRRGAVDPSSVDVYRDGVGRSVGASATRILDRFLNVLPTVTIREGHRVFIALTHDLALPLWQRL